MYDNTANTVTYMQQIYVCRDGNKDNVMHTPPFYYLATRNTFYRDEA